MNYLIFNERSSFETIVGRIKSSQTSVWVCVTVVIWDNWQVQDRHVMRLFNVKWITMCVHPQFYVWRTNAFKMTFQPRSISVADRTEKTHSINIERTIFLHQLIFYMSSNIGETVYKNLMHPVCSCHTWDWQSRTCFISSALAAAYTQHVHILYTIPSLKITNQYNQYNKRIINPAY